MANVLLEDHYTVEEYFELEYASLEIAHEYIRGQVIARDGRNLHHNVIFSNLLMEIAVPLRETDFYVFGSRLRLETKPLEIYRYPDMSVYPSQFISAEINDDTLTNPILLVEILSDFTEQEDRTEKLYEYQSINSLQEYLIIAQNAPRIERFLRQDDGNWLYTRIEGTDKTLHLPSIGCTLELSEVYRRIEFENTNIHS